VGVCAGQIRLEQLQQITLLPGSRAKKLCVSGLPMRRMWKIIAFVLAKKF
jgi:hypothetical protein